MRPRPEFEPGMLVTTLSLEPAWHHGTFTAQPWHARKRILKTGCDLVNELAPFFHAVALAAGAFACAVTAKDVMKETWEEGEGKS